MVCAKRFEGTRNQGSGTREKQVSLREIYIKGDGFAQRRRMLEAGMKAIWRCTELSSLKRSERQRDLFSLTLT